jgi:predicted Zn-dependent protease with MMP-like domain
MTGLYSIAEVAVIARHRMRSEAVRPTTRRAALQREQIAAMIEKNRRGFLPSHAQNRRVSGARSEATRMEDTTNTNSFEEIVEWAYSTLPQKIRRLPDFPGIQVLDEPPPDVFAEMASERKWRPGTELLGLYSGTLRTKRSFSQLKYAPDLIFVFRGPILRSSKGDLRAEVKRVVWHEVAHWLGYETEEQVKALGL